MGNKMKVKCSSEKREKQTLEGGVEPPTLWLTATRSNQLSYSSFCFKCIIFLLLNLLLKNEYHTLILIGQNMYKM